MVLAVFSALVWFGFGLSEAIAQFPITSKCFFNPNMSLQLKNWPNQWFWVYFCLVLDCFFFLLFLVLIQILNVLAKPFPMIPNTPESDLKCMRYRVGKMTNIFTYIQNSFICLDICVQANIYKLSLAKVCSNKLRLKINKTNSAFLG